jgi:hypothetical protein
VHGVLQKGSGIREGLLGESSGAVAVRIARRKLRTVDVARVAALFRLRELSFSAPIEVPIWVGGEDRLASYDLKTKMPASITKAGRSNWLVDAAMGTDRVTWRAVHPQWGTSFLEGVEALAELGVERLHVKRYGRDVACMCVSRKRPVNRRLQIGVDSMHSQGEEATSATRVKFGATSVQQQECPPWI